MSFGHYLRTVRQAHGYTQEQLEERLRDAATSISQSELSRLERGEDLPTWSQMDALEGVLNGEHREGAGSPTAWDDDKAVELVRSDARKAS